MGLNAANILFRCTERHTFCTYLQPVLTYACETWSRTQADEDKLQNFDYGLQ